MAITRTVWDQCVKVPQGLLGYDQRGRLWDILVTLNLAIKAKKEAGSTLIFTVYVKQENRKWPALVRLKSVMSAGDDPKPVITIMLPEET